MPGEFPQAFMHGFQGFLQADGFSGYDPLVQASATRVGCWAQIRWYFFEARLAMAETDARHMPISRDLSSAKRSAMIAWLNAVGPDGKPLRGVATPAPLAVGIPLGKAAFAQETLK